VVAPVRLRQVVLITRDLPAITGRLEAELGLATGFEDEGVGYFGLANRVLAVGDSFIEVVTPLTEESAGHRYLERRGMDGGYMAIFQFRDREAPRRRAAELGIRVVWQADLEDISGTHLDPRDVPGAIVSLDWADPPESWHWAGPAWRGNSATASAARRGGVTSLEVAVGDPPAAAARWAEVLGPDVQLDGSSIRLPEARQVIAFVASSDRLREGIVGCGLTLCPVDGMPVTLSTEIGGVRFAVGSPSHRQD
jgi:Glyoxalase-like domain